MIHKLKYLTLPLSRRLIPINLALLLGSALALQGGIVGAEEEMKKGSSAKVLNFEEIIVTGQSRGKTQFDASYAVTSLSDEAVSKLAPLNMADLIGLVPGVFTESTGGEVQNVYRIRGIPNEGSFTTFQQDGLPTMGYPQGFFIGTGVTNRIDIMTENMEVVRGGPAPIYADNAIAIFNNVSRRGSGAEEGAIRVTAGDIGLSRVDGYWSGPIGESTYLAVGGFLRTSDGYRDNGYKGDEGGQVRINITRELEDGSFNIFGQYLDDHNAFYLPVPLADPTTGASLSHLLDPFTGTMNSEYMQAIKLVNSDGDGGKFVQDRDLSNGRHVKMRSLGFEYETQLTDTWHISNKMRYSEIDLIFDALYSAGAPSNADDYAAGYLGAAQAAFGAVTNIDYEYAVTGGAFDPATTGGLVVPGTYRAVDNELFNFVNDLRASAQLGDHEVVVGVLLSHYGEKAQRRYMNYIFEMKERPQPVNLIARDAAGNALGSITENGVVRQGAFAQGFKETADHIAIYASDNWQVSDKLRLEAGFRYQKYDYEGGRWGQETVDLGDPTTLADDAVMGITSKFNPTGNVSSNAVAWTVGANYDILDDLAVYARVSRSYSVQELYGQSGGNTGETQVDQYEFGVKYNSDMLALFATAFLIQFEPLIENLEGTDGTSARFEGIAEAPGIEVLGILTLSDLFSVTTSFTYVKHELTDLKNISAGSATAAPNGNLIRRQPKSFGYVSPEISFDLGDAAVSAYIRYNFVGKRWVDYNNSTELPAYQTVSAAVSVDWNSWQIQLSGSNLTDEFGLTEGNPRTDALAGQGTPKPNYGRPLFGRNVSLAVTYNF